MTLIRIKCDHSQEKLNSLVFRIVLYKAFMHELQFDNYDLAKSIILTTKEFSMTINELIAYHSGAGTDSR